MDARARGEITGRAGAEHAIVQSSSLLRILPHALRMLKREPAVAITIGYLLVALAGIFFNYRFYGRFGVPVLTLSQISDFLVAGVQEPMAILLVLSTLPLCWIFDWINLRNRRRRAVTLMTLRTIEKPGWLTRSRIASYEWWARDRWLLPLMFPFIIVLYGWLFVRAYADMRADEVIRGDARQVSVWLTGDASPLAPSCKTWTYLGATSAYVFVYDNSSRRAVILPVNNIVRIEPMVRAETGSHTPIVVPIL